MVPEFHATRIVDRRPVEAISKCDGLFACRNERGYCARGLGDARGIWPTKRHRLARRTSRCSRLAAPGDALNVTFAGVTDTVAFMRGPAPRAKRYTPAPQAWLASSLPR